MYKFIILFIQKINMEKINSCMKKKCNNTEKIKTCMKTKSRCMEKINWCMKYGKDQQAFETWKRLTNV